MFFHSPPQEVPAEVEEKEPHLVHGVWEDVTEVMWPYRVKPVLSGHLRASCTSQCERASLRLGAEGVLPW